MKTHVKKEETTAVDS